MLGINMLKIWSARGSYPQPMIFFFVSSLGFIFGVLLLLGFAFSVLHIVSCFSQVLACRLPPGFRNRRASLATVQGVDMRPLHGQVCCFCQNEWPSRVLPAVLLHDGRQGGQDPRAAGEFRGGCQEQRHWGTGSQEWVSIAFSRYGLI